MKDLSTYLKESLQQGRVAQQLTAALATYKEFSYIQEYEYQFTGMHADFMLMYKSLPFAVIGVKRDLTNHNLVKMGEAQLATGRVYSLLRFGILTDGNNVYLYDWWQDEQKQRITNLTLVEAINYIYQTRDESILHANIDNLNKSKEKLHKLINQIFPHVQIQITEIEVGESKIIKLQKQAECRLFDTLFPPCKEPKICRFTTLPSFFTTVEKNSFRMFATEGMNDTEDSNFLWEKLYGKKDKERILPTDRDSIFILSCSPIKTAEELTMWRLYGDDTKGVCLVFDIGDNAQKDGFSLREVQYEGISDIIDNFKILTKSFYEETGFIFVFNYWDLWGAFVKSKEYAIESEIRLAYIPSLSNNACREKKWIITKSNQIVSEYADFEECAAKTFPLRLKSVILGASCPEKEINMTQLKKMIESSKGFGGKNISVELSEITNYRPSISKN